MASTCTTRAMASAPPLASVSWLRCLRRYRGICIDALGIGFSDGGCIRDFNGCGVRAQRYPRRRVASASPSGVRVVEWCSRRRWCWRAYCRHRAIRVADGSGNHEQPYASTAARTHAGADAFTVPAFVRVATPAPPRSSSCIGTRHMIWGVDGRPVDVLLSKSACGR